jgi:ABC-type transport system substrate-binding protein
MSEDIRAEAAKYYDVSPTIPDDLAFYRARLPVADAAVLELGCGTGRVLLPLAARCGFIQGLDRSQAMLKRQEADVAYGMYGAVAEEIRRDPTLKLEPTVPPTPQWVVFTYEQYNPKSPWSDQRVRLAANHAVNRHAVNEAETLGHSVLSGSIIPRAFDYALPFEPYAYDPQKAKQLLKEAGYANGFDMGECSVDAVYAGVVEAIVNDLGSVGIRGRVRPMERAGFIAAHKEHTLKHLAFQGSGAFGNAATRLGAFVYSKGENSWIKDPDSTW